eukprot:scaffold956_cov389-Pavlova_lutheri.AAC.10
MKMDRHIPNEFTKYTVAVDLEAHGPWPSALSPLASSSRRVELTMKEFRLLARCHTEMGSYLSPFKNFAPCASIEGVALHPDMIAYHSHEVRVVKCHPSHLSPMSSLGKRPYNNFAIMFKIARTSLGPSLLFFEPQMAIDVSH